MRSALAGLVVFVGLQLLPLPEGVVLPRAGEVPLLDFTVPRSVGATAVDQSLGFTARCPGCALAFEGGRFQGRVTDYPIVATVVAGGVADEAGLRPGDVITMIAGRDVRNFVGDSPLFDLPSLDFVVGYRRETRDLTAHMNRRIVDTRGLSEPPPRTDGMWSVVVRGMQLRADRREPIERTPGGPRFLAEPIVSWLDPEGAAAAAGLQVGDAVVHVDGVPVGAAAGGQALLAPHPEQPMRVTVRRSGRLIDALIRPPRV